MKFRRPFPACFANLLTPRLLPAATTCAIALCVTDAHALTNSWMNSGFSNWFTGSNWSLGSAPNNSHNVILDGGTASISSAGARGYQLMVGFSTSGGLQINSGGTLAVEGSIIGHGAGTNSSVLLSGGTWSHSMRLDSVWIGNHGTGSVTVNSNGTLSMDNGNGWIVLGNEATGHGMLNIGSPSGVVAVAPGKINGTQITTGAGTGTLVFNHTSENYYFTKTGAAGGAAVALSGNLHLRVEHGTTTLTSAATHTGGTTFASGTLRIEGGSIGDSNSSLTVGNASSDYGTLELAAGGTATSTLGTIAYSYGQYTFGNARITGSGSEWSTTNNGMPFLIGRGGAGFLTLSEGGKLTVVGGAGDVELGALASARGRLAIGGAAGWIAFAPGIVNANSIFGGNGTGDVYFNHSSPDYWLTKTGTSGGEDVPIQGGLSLYHLSGTTNLRAANSYSAGTTVAGGTLVANSSSAFPQNTAYAVNGGTLNLNGHALTASSLSGAGGAVSLGSASLTVNQSVDTTYAGSLSGTGSAGLVKLGTGNLTLAGTSSYPGETHANGGTLTVTGSVSTTGLGVGRLDNSTAAVAVNGSGATLTVSGGGSYVTVGDNPGSTGTLTVGDGGLVSLGSGTKLTVGWNNATGAFHLNPGGTLQVGGTDGIQKHATGTTAFNLAGGTLRVTNADLTTSLPMTLSGTGPAIDTNGLAATFSGALSGTGALTKTGTGTLTLSAPNAYTGSTTVNGGTLALSAASLADAADVSVASGAVLQLGFTGTDTIGKLYLNGIPQPVGTWGGMSSAAPNKTPYLTGTGLLNVTASGTMTFAGWISTFGLTGNDALAAADPDNDGLANLLEWALGGNPTQNDSAARQPQIARDGNELVVTFQRSDASELDGGLLLAAGYSANLKTWTEVEIGAASAVVGGVTITIAENDGEPDDITVRIPLGTNPALFARLRATEN